MCIRDSYRILHRFVRLSRVIFRTSLGFHGEIVGAIRFIAACPFLNEQDRAFHPPLEALPPLGRGLAIVWYRDLLKSRGQLLQQCGYVPRSDRLTMPGGDGLRLEPSQ